jgi:hypothetical protein
MIRANKDAGANSRPPRCQRRACGVPSSGTSPTFTARRLSLSSALYECGATERWQIGRPEAQPRNTLNTRKRSRS